MPIIKNDVMFIGIFDIFRIGYFGLESNWADQTYKSFCMYIFLIEPFLLEMQFLQLK